MYLFGFELQHADELRTRERARERAKQQERASSEKVNEAEKKEMQRFQEYLAEIAATLPAPQEVPSLSEDFSYSDAVQGIQRPPPAPVEEPTLGGYRSFRQALLNQPSATEMQAHWGPAPGGGGKKKGKAKVLLSTTGGRRG